MVTTEPTSGIVVRIPVPAGIMRLRRRWDRTAGVGVPAHVTIMFPFVPADGLVPEVRRELAAIAGTVEPFDVAFCRVGRFPTVVYLAPDPPDPFEALTTAVMGAFPGYLPYGGAFDGIVPHLTVTDAAADDVPLDRIAVEAERSLPFRRRVGALEVLVETPDGRWHPRWRLPLGVRP